MGKVQNETTTAIVCFFIFAAALFAGEAGFFTIETGLDRDQQNTILVAEHPFSDCQPLDFDPGKSSPGELHEGIVYRKEKPQKFLSYTVIVYSFGCASSEDYVIEVLKENKRYYLFTHVLDYKISRTGDHVYLYLYNSLENSKQQWQVMRRVVDFDRRQKTVLAPTECFQERFSHTTGFFDSYFLAFSISNKLACIFSAGGELRSIFRVKDINSIYSPSAAGGYSFILPYGIRNGIFYFAYASPKNFSPYDDSKGDAFRHFSGGYDIAAPVDLYTIDVQTGKHRRRWAGLKYDSVEKDIDFIFSHFDDAKFSHSYIRRVE